MRFLIAQADVAHGGLAVKVITDEQHGLLVCGRERVLEVACADNRGGLPRPRGRGQVQTRVVALDERLALKDGVEDGRLAVRIAVTRRGNGGPVSAGTLVTET